MPARGTGAPTIARDRPCRRCGADEWRKCGGKKKGFRCAGCTRTDNRKREREKWRRQPVKAMWNRAKQRAARDGVAFTIAVEDVRAVWPTSGRCPVLNIPLAVAIGRLADGSPSLDRINPAWGYEPGNVAVISNKANRAKNNLTARELDLIVRWMRRNGLN